jgi:uncharacterized protein YecE (DUF72 family)
MAGGIYIGTQGWNYDGWCGSFYPAKTQKQEHLKLYGKIFNTVEVDSSFYAIPPESSIQSWYEKTPNEFKFSLKLPREITHQNRLRESDKLLTDFCARTRVLKEKLACILVQLPPDFTPRQHSALSNFLPILPNDIRFAFEFRDRNWLSRSLVEELEGYGTSLALVDGKWIPREISISLIPYLTSPFCYIRWLGAKELTDYSRIQIDRSKEFDQWRDAIQTLTASASDIYGYFNNHFQGHSPASANQLKALLGLPVISPDALIIQPGLF